jgi:YafQ family addiction module toxin component
MYDLELRKSVEKAFFKLVKKNTRHLEAIFSKLEEIRRAPHRFKNLKKPLQHLKRVHIGKSYVLVFSVDESRRTVIVEAYEHHDKIYG